MAKKAAQLAANLGEALVESRFLLVGKGADFRVGDLSQLNLPLSKIRFGRQVVGFLLRERKSRASTNRRTAPNREKSSSS